MPYHAFHPFGLERQRAEVLRHLCANAPAIERLAALPPEQARERLTTYPGVGVWTAAEVSRLALGDADAVSVGDYHLPHLVSSAFAGEPRGTDARMVELLEPYRGHRGRVQRLLEAGRDRRTEVRASDAATRDRGHLTWTPEAFIEPGRARH